MENLDIRKIEKLDWYHTIELSGSYATKGRYDWRPYIGCLIQFIGDLNGKTVLDVGTGNGFFAFEFEKLGAVVTASDIAEQSQRDNNLIGIGNVTRAQEYNNYDFNTPFSIAKDALNSNVKRIEINLYDMSSENTGMYDIVFCNDVLLHLSDPIRALWVLRRVCKGRLVIGVPVIESEMVTTGTLRAPITLLGKLLRDFAYLLLSRYAIAEYCGAMARGEFWIPNIQCLREMVKGSGFVNIHSTIIRLQKEHNSGSSYQSSRGFVIGDIQ